MWKQLLEFLRQKLKGENGVRLVVFLGIAGLVLILLSGFLPDKAKPSSRTETSRTETTASDLSMEQYCRQTEQQLVSILEQVEGVGTCQVMLTADGTSETIYAQDQEQEQGESRTKIQKKCVIVSDSGSQQPLVQQVVAPEISGVIVVCSGASSAVVQERVTKAVQAVLHLAASRICVVPGGVVNTLKGNTAQRASGDFVRHLLANFPSYFTKMLVNTSSIHSAFCFI